MKDDPTRPVNGASRPAGSTLASRRRLLFGGPAIRDGNGNLQYRVSGDPDLVPPPLLMLEEADEVLEDWFAGGAEQATLLRLLADVHADSKILEIGCGLGRLAHALRLVLTDGAYIGVDVVDHKIDFLASRLGSRAPQFQFHHLDVGNAMYNPTGQISPPELRIPCADAWADAAVAMAVLTHLLPDTLDRYLAEIARILRPGGRFLASLYLLDQYLPGRPRPDRYNSPEFSFDHEVPGLLGTRTSDPDCPERMLAVELKVLIDMAALHGLALDQPPRAGSWSGRTKRWTTGQDLVLFCRS